MVGPLLYLWAASVNTSERSFRAWIVEIPRCCGMEVLRARVRFTAAAMTKSSGVTNGFVRYLCLKNAAPEIRVAWVEFPTWIVFGGRDKDKRLFAVFCIDATFVWFVLYKCLHPN